MNGKDSRHSLSILLPPASITHWPHRRFLFITKPNPRSRLRLILQAFCILFLFIPTLLFCEAFAQEIIVNPSLAGEQDIKLNALRAIFSMRLRTWPDGTPVRVFVLDDDQALHVKFAKKRLDIYPHQLRYSWDRLVYSGTGQAPTEVASEKEMLEKVAATPGAIGYLPESLINDKVHVLMIKTP